MSEDDSPRLHRSLEAGMVIAGVCAIGLLFVELGFPLTATTQNRIAVSVRIVLWIIFIVEAIRVLLHPDRHRFVRSHLVQYVVGAGLIGLLALEFMTVPRLEEIWPHAEPGGVALLYLGSIQVAVLALIAHRSLQLTRFLAFTRVSPRQILIGSYLALIALGALLLKLPNATTAPGSLAWLDALFTSTSAVCVTGLIVVDTATAFTPMGKAVLLVLIQLGGLGLMTFTYFFVTAFGGGITIKDRTILVEFLNEENVGRITGSLIAIVVMTFAFEAAGAVLLHTSMASSGAAPAVWFDSVFQSVSAFCNAGFSTFTRGLFDPSTRSLVSYQCVIMALIVVGGLGFPVLRNLWDNARSHITHRGIRPPRLTVNTKIVVATTAGLIVGGTVLILLFELGPANQEQFTSRGLTALFLSITSRTAGFNTIPTEGLLVPTAMAVICLMFIGGGPASAAGGIKTTTFAVALLNAIRILRQSAGKGLVAFGRQIPADLANRAFAVALLSIAWVALSSLVLSALMPQEEPLDIVFEAVSAFATVGLSRGLTAELPAAGKCVIIASMIVGRIGILYAALGVLGRERPGRIIYPEENVIIS
ncbi:MAG TPA: potassium transporter TrkG [Opitutaceae bacterium]